MDGEPVEIPAESREQGSQQAEQLQCHVCEFVSNTEQVLKRPAGQAHCLAVASWPQLQLDLEAARVKGKAKPKPKPGVLKRPASKDTETSICYVRP